MGYEGPLGGLSVEKLKIGSNFHPGFVLFCSDIIFVNVMRNAESWRARCSVVIFENVQSMLFFILNFNGQSGTADDLVYCVLPY